MLVESPKKERTEITKESQNYSLSDFSASSEHFAGHIVALIPRGEVIRNFVHTNSFNQIASQAKLTLLTVSPDPETDAMLREKYQNVFPLEEHRERWPVRVQREILDMAHGRWLWSKAAQERWRLRDAEADTISKKIVRTIKKTVAFPFANRQGLKFLSFLERKSSIWLKTTDAYVKLYQMLKPTLVFNGSHVHSTVATQAVQAANWLRIPTATFIFSWDNLSSQGRIMLPYDYFLVWNESLRQQLLEMYEWIRPEQVVVTGTPQFDFHFRPEFYWSREKFCQSVGADSTRPIVLYTTGMPNHMPGEPDIVAGIADILKDLDELNRPQLLVRVYPKDLSERFAQLKRERADILFPSVAWEKSWLTPKSEDSYALVNALRHAAVGINVASTVSLELCMFDKPVLNIGYNPDSVETSVLAYADYYDFDHYKPVVESGAVQVARSRAELRDLIIQALADPNERKDARKFLLERMFSATLDGQSGVRVAQKLLERASKEL